MAVYFEGFEAFARVNKLEEQSKTDVLITIVGDSAYATLQNLMFPKAPERSTYQEIKQQLQNDYAPMRSIVTEHYNFHKRTQGRREAVDDFIVEFKLLATNCSFRTFSIGAFRDQLVVGVRSEAIQCKLLSAEDEKGLTWDKACDITTSMEAAGNHVGVMLPGRDVNREQEDDERSDSASTR
ncbi:uncharacterized protein [Dermacentor andersoni]|uniref:uncharacterized protein n=1 Tax=Dermacentor andersoni TaxID=34620 RepID=UPI003B3B0EC4